MRGSYPKKDRTSLNETHTRIRLAVDAMPGKAVWYMPQMYPYSYWSLRPEEEYTLADMRLASYAGLIAGAKGMVFYHWGLLDKAWGTDEKGSKQKLTVDDAIVAQRLRILSALVKELHAVGSIICDGRVNEEPDIRWVEPGLNGPGPQLTRCIEYDGRQYLLVMNLLDVAIEGLVFGPDPAHNYRAYDVEVFLGTDSLSVKTERPGEPRIIVGPRGAGVFALSRRSIIPKE